MKNQLFDQTDSELSGKSISAEQRQVREQKLIASRPLYPGHTMYEFCLASGEVTAAKIEQNEAKSGPYGTVIITHKVVQRPGHLYAGALNPKNAIKKFIPMYERLVKSGHIVRPNTNPSENENKS